MSPRRSAVEAAETRTTIVDETVARASREGLEAVTIGGLAQGLEMSKAGVIGHFGTKQGLQLAAVERAVAMFRREVWEPAADAAPGLERLLAITEAWLSYLDRDVFPGGCFLTAAAAEFDGRSGPVREAIDEALSLWSTVLEADAAIAIERGQIPAEADPAQIAFELGAIVQGVNQARQLRGDAEATRRGRRAMHRALYQ
jgi:AcrR family transcriptional regulator